ncbi:MAG TPA: ABC transporter ATP-binding protein [Clostridia bacterium]|nr:ABC transporter ATP-binding protein [Clostridia bacterium]
MIRVEKMCFSYSKRNSFINDMNFNVDKGEIFGFLGPSGAGKSTVQKILTGILKDYEGSVRVLGSEVKGSKRDFYQQIGVDFEFPNLYGKFTALENLNFFSSLYNRKGYDPMELLERVGLKNDAFKRVSEFSKGMKMRLSFIRAIQHKPMLIFLDEPTSGLDPANARTVKDMILEQKREGRSILLTTHNMHDAEELCDRVAFIVDGSIKVVDTPDNLRLKKGSNAVTYTFNEGGSRHSGRAALDGLHENREFMDRLANRQVISIHSEEQTLEDIFIEVTGRCLA